ncbi:hypothetical protein BJY01DRAFT_236975 [Aspergillus pseudoustus]|uniref:Protein kinase domain-containing protein n=1 Tax=Aspergillus pseudoustus TaxID=1810923 RepID=A0ABR4JIG0_9EURO
MITSRKLFDLVADSRLVVKLHGTHAEYFNIAPQNWSEGRPSLRRAWTKETWARTRHLGGGATSEVWLEERRSAGAAPAKKGQLQVVKVVPKQIDFDVYEELEAIAMLSHRSLGWCENEISVFIVTEHMKYGSLFSHLTCPMSEDEGREIITQILEGIAWLHENEFVHRDLKPNSKIGDFGFSKRTSRETSVHSFVGTRKYLAPEVPGLHPYWADRELLAYIKGTSFPVTALTDHAISQEACTFLTALLMAGPTTWASDLASAPDRELPLISRGAVSEPEKLPPPNNGIPHINEDGDHDTRTKVVDDFSALRERGLQLFAEKKYTQAEALFQQAIDGRKQVLMPYDRDTLASMQQLGVSYFLQGRHQDAQRMQQLSADVQAESLESTNINTLASNYWLGSSLLAQRKRDAAQEAVYRAMEIQMMILGVNKEDTVKSLWLGPEAAQARNLLSNVGEALFQGAQYADEESCFEKVVAARKRTLGADEQTLHSTLQPASSLRKQRGKAPRAQDVLREVHNLSPPRITAQGTLDQLQALREVLWSQEVYTAAFATLKEVLAQRRAVVGRQHPDTLRSASWLGRSLLKEKRYEEATALLTSLRKDQREALGPEHLDVAYANLWLAQSLRHQGQAGDAFPHLSTALRRFRHGLGTDHWDTVLCLCYLGSANGQLKEYTAAENTLRSALVYTKGIFGATHGETLRTQVNLGMALYGTKGSLTALWYLLPAVDEQMAALRETHEDTLDTLFCIGAALDAFKRYAESEDKKDLKKCTKALAGKWVIFWPGHQHLQYRDL